MIHWYLVGAPEVGEVPAVDKVDTKGPTKSCREGSLIHAHHNREWNRLRESSDGVAGPAEEVVEGARLVEGAAAEVVVAHSMVDPEEDNRLVGDMTVQKRFVRWLHLKDQGTDMV